ncbi:MAG: hypothetical protein KDA92_13535, partial [Planctomycetales bacterium]|nr:hypothetical protein [Planctomycetales bacterium]
RFERQDDEGAERDCDAALALAPDEPALLLNRALARQRQRRFAESERDLDRVLASPRMIARAYFVRAAVRAQQGNNSGAANDRSAGFATLPTDFQSWLARGMAWLPADPQRAVADLARAREINPRSVAALRNLAYVNSEFLDDLPTAISQLDDALALRPEDADLLASRGVLHARNRQFDNARRDAREALRLDATAQTLLHSACVFALTGSEQPADLDRAASLVQRSLQQEPSWLPVVLKDADLRPLQDHADFRKAIQAARALSQANPGINTLE